MNKLTETALNHRSFRQQKGGFRTALLWARVGIAHLNGHKKFHSRIGKQNIKNLPPKKKLYKEFYRRKENVRKVELIQKSVDNVLRKINCELSTTKETDINL